MKYLYFERIWFSQKSYENSLCKRTSVPDNIVANSSCLAIHFSVQITSLRSLLMFTCEFNPSHIAHDFHISVDALVSINVNNW